MKKLIIILILLCYGGIKINAQTLGGKVFDKDTKDALTGAVVYIPDLKESAVADTSGRYEFRDLPKKQFTVQVMLLGYKSISKEIDFATTKHMDFAMQQSATQGNEVVITGVSEATRIKDDPVPMTAINHNYIQQNMATNAIDAIAKVPGVSAVTTGPNVSKPFIRGLGYNRVLSLFDGQRIEGQQWGDEHGIEVDQYAIDKIEVIKGPASLMYGSDALAGVVSMIPTPTAPEGKTEGSLLNEYQTNNKMIGNSLMLSANHNDFSWLIRGSHKMAIDYQNRYDKRNYGTAFQESDASGVFGINKNWGYSRLNFALYDDLQEIPDGSRDSLTGLFTKQVTEEDTLRSIATTQDLTTYKISALHQHVQHYMIYSTNNVYLGQGHLSFDLGMQRSIRREYIHPTAVNTPGLYLIEDTYTYGGKYYFQHIKGWTPTVGINGMYQDNNATKGTDFPIPSYHLFDAGGFAVVKKSFGSLNVSGGLRYDIRLFNNSALYTETNPATGFDMAVTGSDTVGADRPFYSYKHTFSGVTGNVGCSYNLTEKLLVKGDVARGYRAPNIEEISANGVAPGEGIYQMGNLNFKPELSLQEDVGVAYTSAKLIASMDLFNNTISNYIYNKRIQSKLGGDSIVVPGYQTFEFSASTAQLYGGELSFDIHPTKWLHFENGFSAVYAINKGNSAPVQDSAKYLPHIPPVHFSSDLRATFKKKYTHFSHIFAKIEVVDYAAQNRVFLAYGTETPTPGYTLFNAGVGANVTNKSGKTLLKVIVTGDNLLDVAYQSNMSRLKYFGVNYVTGRTGMYNMGRNIGFRVVVPLGN